MKPKFYMLLIACFLLANFKSFSQANTSLSNLASPTSINQDLLPDANNTRNLGSAPNSWKTLYIDYNIYLKDSLFLSAKGSQNTFVGQRAGYDLSTGSSNSAYGYHALYNNATGNYNSAFGSSALANNTVSDNTAFGYRALYNNTTGTGNTAEGKFGLYYNTTGSSNTANGYQALFNNTVGSGSTATGYQALYFSNSFYDANTADGYRALYSNSKGQNNTATGKLALYSNTTGADNTAVGHVALYHNTTGFGNTAVGFYALFENTGDDAVANTAIGYEALVENSGGNGNTAVGYGAISNVYTKMFNITAIGVFAGVSTHNDSITNATAIGADAFVTDNNQARVGNTNVTSIGGQVGWTSFSDGRYKKNIKQDVQGLVFINSLQPITYTVDINGLNEYYNKGRKQDSGYEKMKADMKQSADKASKIIYNGFIAQDVEKAAAKLNYNFSGVDKPQSKDGLYGLRYADFVVPLVKAVQELSKQNDSLKNDVAKQQQINTDLEARLQKLEAMMNISSQSTSVSSASLAQNVPNPFGSSTNISYSLPQSYLSARIIITDKKGVVLKETSLNARGKGNLNVDASTLAAGAYQYSLYVNGRLIDTKQMVLSR